MFKGQRVVITGAGVLAANGNDKEAFWSSLLAGRSGVGPITLFDCSGLPCRIAGEVKDFDPSSLVPPDKRKSLKRMSRATQLAMAAVREAITDTGLSLADFQRYGTPSFFSGTSTTAMDLRARPARPWSAVMGVPHALGSAVAHNLGLRVRLTTVSTGCASGLDCVVAAANEIQAGRSEFALGLAADSSMELYTFECFKLSRKLSLRNDDPQHADRPFDRDRDGGVIAEGAGAVLVENLDHALSRKAPVYAEILGYGTSLDPPEGLEGSGLEHAMQAALEHACLPVTAIGAISAHAPGDEHMDTIEVQAIKRVFGGHAYRIPVHSIKGVTANPMGVGGMHQLIAGALSLRAQVLPPTANLEHTDPRCDLDHIPGEPRPMALQHLMINTHGFGRGNTCLILGAYPRQAARRSFNRASTTEEQPPPPR